MKWVLWAGMLLAATAAFGRTVALTWTDADSGVTFSVYRGSALCSTNPAFNFIASGISVLTYMDSTVAVGTTYCYYVTAVDTATNSQSAPSNKVNANIVPHTPLLKVPVISWLGRHLFPGKPQAVVISGIRGT